MSKFINYMLKIGDFLLFIFKLHISNIVHILRGGIILGIFPSLISTWKIFFNFYQNKNYEALSNFSKYWKEYFKISNILGFFSLIILLFFLFDIYIAINFLNQPLLVLFLFFICFVIIGCMIFLFPSVIRYDLSYVKHIKQAFFLLLCSFPEFIASILGISLSGIVFIFFPILFILGAIPLAIFPITWFTYQALIKLEGKNI